MADAAFPTGAYAHDKRVTPSGKRNDAAKGVTLDALQGVVDQIIAHPTAQLTPKVLQDLPRELDACQSAIALRKHMASFFATSLTEPSAATASHEHFLNRLKTWYVALRQVEMQAVDEGKVLSLDAEYFESPSDVDEPDGEWTVGTHAGLLFETVSYLLELEDLTEGVHHAYHQVKLHKKTLFEATAVVKTAIECAKALTAKFQLWYPSIKLAQDLLTILSDRLPRGVHTKMTTAVAGMWERFGKVVRRECAEFFGDAYSEEMTPHDLLPDPSKPSSFLLQQLPLLYNTILAMKASSSKIRATTLTGEFLVLMDEFFTTKKVTLPLVFVANCWMKSVGYLMTVQHSWNLMDRLDRTLAKRVVLTADQEIHDLLGAVRAEIVESKKGWMLMRAKPLMAGFMMLDYQFNSVEMLAMEDRINATSRLLRLKFAPVAAQAIHLMQKFHRFDHKDHLKAALAPLKEVCDTTDKFGKFVIETAQVLGSLDRKQQARELLDLLEKRLLSLLIQSRPSCFRYVVQKCARERQALGLGKFSSLKVRRKLTWYLKDVDDDYEVQMKLDALGGFEIYLAMTSTDLAEDFDRLKQAIERVPERKHVVCYNGQAMFSSHKGWDHVATTHELFQVIKDMHAHFDGRSACAHDSELYFDRFVVSVEGIVLRE
uniref:Uncharacterized protein n=1 Tax=Globisporangium ultimum (strain ATCC 200006 / CBS 805.95 / DAOM BR144) TaxID=431595 RepID=K3WJG1_GLOUD